MNQTSTGLVVRALASFFYVQTKDDIIECRASKKLKLKKNKIIVGDYVDFDLETNYITNVKERKNYLVRPLIANVSNALLVFSITNPQMNFQLLDKMILIMEESDIHSHIVITKNDLIEKDEAQAIKEKLKYYEKIGYNIIYTDINGDVKAIEKLLENDKYVITGQTGVGKSTLLNNLIPNLNLQTQEISKALNRGKHTTREVTFYKFKNNYLIDTPGFSSIEIPLKKEKIRDNFIEFSEYDHDCKFNNCFHDKEPKCAVKDAVESKMILKSRYDSYIKLLNEVKEIKWKK